MTWSRLLITTSYTKWQIVQIQISWIYAVCQGRVYPGSAGRGLNLSHLMTKCHMHPVKTQISLGIHPIWPVFAVCIKKAWVLRYPWSAKQRLIRLNRCPGWSESLLGTHVILLVLSWGGSNFIVCFRYLQAILEEHGAKPQGQRPGSGSDVSQGNGKGVKVKLPVSQVDIMQMLSKAQQEYDTVGFHLLELSLWVKP